MPAQQRKATTLHNATVSSPPQALGPAGVVCGRACVCSRHCLCINTVTKRLSSWACIGNPNPEQETSKGTHAQETSTSLYSVFRPGQAQRFRVLTVFLGAGELPRRLVFSCVCAGRVPVAPAVGAVLVCACGPGGRRCGLMCVWYIR